MRERLRALAAGRSGAADPVLTVPGPAEEEAPGEGPRVEVRRALRPVAVAVAATALAAWAVVRVTGGGPPSPVELVAGTPVPSVSGVLAPHGAGVGPTPDPTASGGTVVVHVVGQVLHPGLVSLAAGSRVADAVRAAGGLVRGGSSGGLNLARVVADGEQIVVAPDAPTGPVPGAAAATAVVVDLNAATATDLDALPGVGPVTAARILDWRTAHGRFTTVDQLREVEGIGALTFERLRPHVRV